MRRLFMQYLFEQKFHPDDTCSPVRLTRLNSEDAPLIVPYFDGEHGGLTPGHPPSMRKDRHRDRTECSVLVCISPAPNDRHRAESRPSIRAIHREKPNMKIIHTPRISDVYGANTTFEWDSEKRVNRLRRQRKRSVHTYTRKPGIILNF